MNDLDLVTDLTPEAPLAGPGELAAARDRLCAAITAEQVGKPAPARRLGPARRSRAARWRGSGGWAARRLAVTAAAVALAAAGATALVVVPGHGAPTPSATRPQPASPAPGAGAGSGQAPAAVDLAAARFLRKAAATVRRQAPSAPRASQFVYTETDEPGYGLSRDWLSADGSRDGFIHNARQRGFVTTPCTVAQSQVARKSPPGVTFPRTYHCAEAAGYLPQMPADPGKLLAFLDRVGIANTDTPNTTHDPAWMANDLGKAVDYLMQTTYLLPAQQAALFELMAQTPGFTVVHGARDAVGRVGVGIKWTFEGSPAEIILNPQTYAYMGDRTWPDPGFHGPDASGYDGVALIDLAIVSKAGQLP